MKPFWSDGLKFECQGSGNCCVFRGEYGFVYLTLKDRQRMAKKLGIPTREFTRKYCKKTEGYFHIDDGKYSPNCRFLKDNKCSVYEARPTQCRTWPFWPEVLKPKAWSKEVKNFCPGVGKGKIWTRDQIQEQLEIQKQSDREL